MTTINKVLEILTWKSKPGVSDKKMINAVDAMVIDLKKLPGFLNQTLYLDDDGTWIDIYYWSTEQDAHNSNEAMADKDSFKALMPLIEEGSVTMKVVTQKQASGKIQLEQ